MRALRVFCALFLLAIGAIPVAAVETCQSPEDNSLCYQLCGDTTSCTTCCQVQYDNKTDSWFSLVKFAKKAYYTSELNACRGNCITEYNFIYVPSLDKTIPIGQYVDGNETGWYFITDPSFQVMVAQIDPDHFSARVRFVATSSSGGPQSEWIALWTSDEEVRIEIPGVGTTTLFTMNEGIDEHARADFADAIAPYGSGFREHLESVVEISDAEGALFGIGDILKELLLE